MRTWRTTRPRSVQDLLDEIESADALLIATPEYNASVPGGLKNALDWASRPFPDNVLKDKPSAVIGASTGLFGAVWAQAEVRKALKASGAHVLETELPVGMADGAFDDDVARRPRAGRPPGRPARRPVPRDSRSGRAVGMIAHVPDLPLIEDGPPPRERADAARNRLRILEAAAGLVDERGIEHVSMEDVACRAGVGTGTLYRRFGDRAGLALALLEEDTREFQDGLISGPPPLGPGVPASERLRAFGERLHRPAGAPRRPARRRRGDRARRPRAVTRSTRRTSRSCSPRRRRQLDAPLTARSLLATLGPGHVPARAARARLGRRAPQAGLGRDVRGPLRLASSLKPTITRASPSRLVIRWRVPAGTIASSPVPSSRTTRST